MVFDAALWPTISGNGGVGRKISPDGSFFSKNTKFSIINQSTKKIQVQADGDFGCRACQSANACSYLAQASQ